MPELYAITTYNRLALRASKQGATEQALLHISNAIRLSRECARPLLEAHARQMMGQVYAQAGRPDLAARCCRTALGLLSHSVQQPATRRLARVLSTKLAAFEQA